MPFQANIEKLAEENTVDQFFRVEKGQGKAVLNGVEYQIESGFAVVIPAGTKHNIINTSGEEEMKLYTVYSPLILNTSSKLSSRLLRGYA